MKRMSRTRAVLAGGLAVATLGSVAAGVGVARADGEGDGRARAGEREIAALFDRWNAALRSGDPERVTELYAEDAVLLPTASPRIRAMTSRTPNGFDT
ncbi:SgcJ/EcaC family oxidoreductase [Streptomyces omiyaensis]|uniref:SgcJ/EcaC family oxidoreductase n=1 Tax=Streptomyces omiyaensis TaxID=68247 RepID=A0ABW7BU64_9ACTN